jgi:hypothetical protein
MANLDVDIPRTKEDIEECISLYKISEDFLNIKFEDSVKALMMRAKLKKFTRIIRSNGKIIAWITAERTLIPFSSSPCFYITAYGSNQTGVMAFRCIEILHKLAEKEAIALGCKFILTTSNPYDLRLTYVRILERLGWIRQSYMAKLTLAVGDPPMKIGTE